MCRICTYHILVQLASVPELALRARALPGKVVSQSDPQLLQRRRTLTLPGHEWSCLYSDVSSEPHVSHLHTAYPDDCKPIASPAAYRRVHVPITH
jgi:hypothetical protein